MVSNHGLGRTIKMSLCFYLSWFLNKFCRTRSSLRIILSQSAFTGGWLKFSYNCLLSPRTGFVVVERISVWESRESAARWQLLWRKLSVAVRRPPPLHHGGQTAQRTPYLPWHRQLPRGVLYPVFRGRHRRPSVGAVAGCCRALNRRAPGTWTIRTYG